MVIRSGFTVSRVLRNFGMGQRGEGVQDTLGTSGAAIVRGDGCGGDPPPERAVKAVARRGRTPGSPGELRPVSARRASPARRWGLCRLWSMS